MPPFQGLGRGRWQIPRAMPWADGLCPFGAPDGRPHPVATFMTMIAHCVQPGFVGKGQTSERDHRSSGYM